MLSFLKKIFFLSSFIMGTFYAAADEHIKNQFDHPVLIHDSGLKVYEVIGQQARAFFDDIARLRLSMFIEYPYLYRGTREYEQEYLENYFKSENSFLYLVLNEENVVGFFSLIPLSEMLLEIQFPFFDQGIDISKYMYLGEAILAPEFRHRKGLLSQINLIFEQHVKEKKYEKIVFMSVIRPDDHPYKPENYVSSEGLFEYFGYKRNDAVIISIPWTQIDTGMETENLLSVWEKQL